MADAVRKRRRQSVRTDKTSLAIEFPDELLGLIKVIAQREERSIAFVVRKACDYWLQNSVEAREVLTQGVPNREALLMASTLSESSKIAFEDRMRSLGVDVDAMNKEFEEMNAKPMAAKAAAK